jgi:hypothetical protein
MISTVAWALMFLALGYGVGRPLAELSARRLSDAGGTTGWLRAFNAFATALTLFLLLAFLMALGLRAEPRAILGTGGLVLLNLAIGWVANRVMRDTIAIGWLACIEGAGLVGLVCLVGYAVDHC